METKEGKPETEIMISVNSRCDSVQDGINNYFLTEMVDNFLCEDCGVNTKLKIEKVAQDYPTMIVVHNIDGHHLIIDRSITIYQENYYLLGFTQIHGYSDESRHYTSVRKSCGNWTIFNDNNVDDFDFEEKKRYPAYILLYHTFTEQPRMSAIGSMPVFETSRSPKMFRTKASYSESKAGPGGKVKSSKVKNFSAQSDQNNNSY